MRVSEKFGLPSQYERYDGVAGLMGREMSALYVAHGGTSTVEGPRTQDRFIYPAVSSSNGALRTECRDTGTDILLTLTYGLNSKGHAFAVSYRIEQGAAVKTGSFTRDLPAEVKAGTLVPFYGENLILEEIVKDAPKRVPALLEEISNQGQCPVPGAMIAAMPF